jgi:hypothetical protein
MRPEAVFDASAGGFFRSTGGCTCSDLGLTGAGTLFEPGPERPGSVVTGAGFESLSAF